MDEGPIKTGNDTEGFQLRGNLKKEFADDSGSITVYAQYIDDQAQFYLPLPLDGASRKRIRGNDGDEVEQVETDQVDGMSYNVPGGVFSSSIGDGVVTKDGSVGIAFDKDLGNDWNVNGKARYASYDHVFDFFLDGDGLATCRRQGGFPRRRRYVPARTALSAARTGRSPTPIRARPCRPTSCCSPTASSIATGRPTT